MESLPKLNADPQIESADFKPVLVNEVEISQPLPELQFKNSLGEQGYQMALILVRLHGDPLGTLTVESETGNATPTDLAARIWALFDQRINRHLITDGLSPVEGLSLDGLSLATKPMCVIKRKRLLENAPLISIVLATRDRVPSLSVTFDSLLTLDYPSYEIILVDNAPSSNETHDFFVRNQPRLAGKNIQLRYVMEKIPGLAAAHNRGLDLVRGSIVAFTDDDVIVDKSWLAEILMGFTAAENVGCVTGLVLPMELQTPAQLYFEEFGGFTKGYDLQIYDMNGHRPDNPLFPYTAGRFGTGANMAFDTNYLLETGGFDPALGIGTPTKGADDMAAFFQAIMHGRPLVYQPSALIFHQHRRTYEGLRKQMFGYGSGLTAFLMKSMLESPRYFTDIVSKIPAGVRYAFSSTSIKNQHKSIRYPVELEAIERRGMMYGPIAYLISRWRYRKIKRASLEEKWGQALSRYQNPPTNRLDE